MYQCLQGLAHWVVRLMVVKDVPSRRECLHASDRDCAGALVINDDDALRRDGAFGDLKRRGNRAFGEQFLSAAQRDRKYLQPERINQIMLQQGLNQIGAAPRRADLARPAF